MITCKIMNMSHQKQTTILTKHWQQCFCSGGEALLTGGEDGGPSPSRMVSSSFQSLLLKPGLHLCCDYLNSRRSLSCRISPHPSLVPRRKPVTRIQTVPFLTRNLSIWVCKLRASISGEHVNDSNLAPVFNVNKQVAQLAVVLVD